MSTNKAATALDNLSPVYYRILATDDGPRVVTMQWFDEFDYDQSKFIGDTFDDEGDAEAAVRALTNIWQNDLIELRDEIRNLREQLEAYVVGGF